MATAAALFRPDAPGFWLAADLLLGLALWSAHGSIPLRWRSLSRVLRWLLMPALALLLGALAPQGLGLAGVDWAVGLTIGVGYALAVLALLAIATLVGRDAAAAVEPSAEFRDAGGMVVVYSFLYHGAEQLHWCFQRAALIAILLAWAQPLPSATYWALWAATLLALPELWLTPAGAPRLYKGIALVATTILFFYTRNFWLCWLLHASIMLFAGAAHVRPELRTRAPRSTPG